MESIYKQVLWVSFFCLVFNLTPQNLLKPNHLLQIQLCFSQDMEKGKEEEDDTACACKETLQGGISAPRTGSKQVSIDLSQAPQPNPAAEQAVWISAGILNVFYLSFFNKGSILSDLVLFTMSNRCVLWGSLCELI